MVEGEKKPTPIEERTILAGERNRLASERTFLSWIRTGIAAIAGGVAISKFTTFEHSVNALAAKLIGIGLLVWGIFIFIFSLVGYHQSYQRLKAPEEFFINFWMVVFFTVSLSILAIALGFIIF